MPDAPRELTSWKQIAAHLGVNVRTAQKWERERSMPIRRLPGGRGRAAITMDALERWKTTKPNLPTEGTTFRWPVDRDMIAEVRFVGNNLTSNHVSRLLEYLTLVKTSLE
jgi:hypothetical protein